MSTIIIYSKAHCPYCDHAKQLLDQKQMHYEEIRIDQDVEQAQKMVALTQRKTVPQIVINGTPIGGFDDLWALEQAGKLDALVKTSDQ